MSGHTPGPWIVDEANPRCVGTPKPNYPRGIYSIVTVLEGGPEYTAEANAKAEADARLIASAPDLLKAATLGLSYAEAYAEHESEYEPHHGGGPWPSTVEAIKAIRAAIAKATGEEVSA